MKLPLLIEPHNKMLFTYRIAIISSLSDANKAPCGSPGLKIGISPLPYVYRFDPSLEFDTPCGGFRWEAQWSNLLNNNTNEKTIAQQYTDKDLKVEVRIMFLLNNNQ